MNKKILGLDLGTNSIGWALVDANQKQILGMGSRIIPMDAAIMGEFDKGNSVSQTAERTDYRGKRRLIERCKLRRERLHRVLNVLGFLPEHYAKEIDFEKHFGQFLDEKEPKLAWKKNEETDKFEFLFQKSFLEMAENFKANGQDIKIPYDWTIYYLRKKALTQKIEKEELAWLLLNFNQKRGYYQLRGEDDEKDDIKEYCQILKVVSVEKGEPDKKNDKKTWYKMTFENGWEYSATFTTEPNWLNTEKEFLITEELDGNGNIKIVKDKRTDTTGKEKRRITPLPSFDEINLMSKEQQDKIYKKIKARTEITITNSGKTVGTYIYETLLQNPTQKIRGKLVRTIKRKYYKEELITILKKQIELQPELFSEEKFNDCIRELYRSNTDRQTILSSKDFLHLFVNDILFYQRPLKSKKSTIGNCSLEYRKYKDKEGKDVKEYLKTVPKSNPYYQEFRLWQWLYNLKIYTRDDDKDVTADFIKSNEDKVNLFDFLMSQKEVNNKDVVEYLLEQKLTPEVEQQIKEQFPKLNSEKIEKKVKTEINKQIKKLLPKYRWNYVFDNSKEDEDKKSKKYPCNETGYEIRRRLKGVENVPDQFFTFENEYVLWHLVYSVTDKNEFEKALISFSISKVFCNNEKSKNKEIRKQVIKFVNEYKPDKFEKKEDYRNKLKNFIDDTFDDDIKTSIHFIVSFFENFKNFKPFPSQYGSFSEKAIKKMLPLMRLGKYWNENAISNEITESVNTIKERIDLVRAEISKRIAKVKNISPDFLTKEKMCKICNSISSISDEKELKYIAKENKLDEISFIENFRDFKIDSFVDSICSKQILKSFFGVTDFTQGLQLYQASYLVYSRHSEAKDSKQWTHSFDIQKYLYEFKQHELRNPIVEQVVTETLRIVQDIWEYYAEKNKIPYVLVYDEHKKKNVKSYPKFFKEIHVELGREMKNTAEDRAKITNQVSENENTNLRIKAMLMEFANDDYFKNKEDYKDEDMETPDFYKKDNNPVRPYSQSQQDILKIYEEYILNDVSKEELDKETGLTETKDGKTKKITYKDISQKSEPTPAQIQKYKLWLEQKYRSPYTGQMISLSRLFTPEYEIEHVIPQSRYFDDSLSNKVICEAAVNKLKDRYLGLEFIKKHAGEKVECGLGKEVEISNEEVYKKFVEEHYKNNNAKRKKLLMEEIPDKMIERQLNDTRYISKLVAQLLSNIVREDNGDDGVNSKNFIPGNGKITDKLKKDWGLNDVWNSLILPRFERMNQLTQSEKFTSKNNEGHTIPAILLELSKGFQKKRIDHRHHAMDALVIACMQREHVQYLNNENAKSQKFHLQQGLAKTIRNFETVQKEVFEKVDDVWKIKKDAEDKQITREIQVPKDYKKPWGTDESKVLAKSDTNFVDDAKKELEKIVVSFKQNLRVINKATNKYEKIKDGKKVEVKQEGTNWAIRQSLHEETVSGIVKLPWVEVGKNEKITATRKILDKSFNLEKIKKITDTGIQKILTNYLKQDKFKIENNKGEVSYNAELAFSPEGLEELNKNIAQYNNGKSHQPIFKVRLYEKGSGRFPLGIKGNKKDKYVQGAPNLFFALYTNGQQQSKGADRKPTNRSFETIPLNLVIERQKQGLTPVPEQNEIGERLLFHLSPEDLVYIPTQDEENLKGIDFGNLNKEQMERIFFVNDFSGSTCYFRPNHIAKSIAPKEVDLSFDSKKKKLSGSFDIKTASFEGQQIKDVCIKLKVDRLGNIKPL